MYIEKENSIIKSVTTTVVIVTYIIVLIRSVNLNCCQDRSPSQISSKTRSYPLAVLISTSPSTRSPSVHQFNHHPSTYTLFQPLSHCIHHYPSDFHQSTISSTKHLSILCTRVASSSSPVHQATLAYPSVKPLAVGNI